ncbi:PIN domain-containing protein [Mesorhizobium sp.]|uniref:PIN domain-containing protein n=1 Tax=Mesorhizobium sp. TaxID=1871066 RepID=UPI000FE9E4A4|nr:PIN domain-containing protein [Mesorhizobium sp.]RWD44083.1 MAG: hypothetical protein EOS35_18190 [Mesorhizobium sp.]
MPTRVFIDANVFISDGRPPGKDVVRALTNLVNNGKIEVLVTNLTINEVTKHFTGHDLAQVKDVLKPSVRQLINDVVDVNLPVLTRDELDDRIWNINKEAVESMLSGLKAVTLDIDDLKPMDILYEYSRQRGMFSLSNKKYQFPDAFILKRIEIETGRGDIIIFTQDGDFDVANNFQGDGNISVAHNPQALFEQLDLTVEDGVIEYFLGSQVDTLIDGALTGLGDFFIYVEEQDELEAEAVSVDAIRILEVGEFETQEGEIFVTGAMEVSATFAFSGPDMSTATYDHEDGRAYAWQETEGEVTQDVTMKFTMTVSLDERGLPEAVESFHFVNDGYIWLQLYDPDEWR